MLLCFKPVTTTNLAQQLGGSDFNSEISLILLATSNKAFSTGLKTALNTITNQLSFSCDETRMQRLLAPLKAPEEDKRKNKTASDCESDT